MKSESESYKAAGVDITAGYRAVELMKQHVARTMIPGVVDGIGGFGGLFELDLTGMKKPVLVSGTDGVGTKLKLAMLLDKHDTIGIDCVAMCVNDVICCGAKPLLFLDYIACGKNVPEKIAQIVAGVAEGCVQAGSALVGGETAEHPGMMPEDDYDLAGFSVGVVDKDAIINREEMQAGDVLLALPSTGVHSNGFSLVRKVFRIGEGGVEPHLCGAGTAPVGDASDTNEDLCEAGAGAAFAGAAPGHQPHYRRRLLREHSAQSEKGHDGPNREGGGEGTADL